MYGNAINKIMKLEKKHQFLKRSKETRTENMTGTGESLSSVRYLKYIMFWPSRGPRGVHWCYAICVTLESGAPGIFPQRSVKHESMFESLLLGRVWIRVAKWRKGSASDSTVLIFGSFYQEKEQRKRSSVRQLEAQRNGIWKRCNQQVWPYRIFDALRVRAIGSTPPCPPLKYGEESILLA